MLTFVALIVGVLLLVSVINGAPYLPTRRAQVVDAIELAQLKKGDTLIDLGSGDGIVLHLAAQRGIRAIGYEINPVLWLVSVIRTIKYRSLVTVHLGSFWSAPLPKTDAVFVFLLDRYMKRLDEKLTDELPRGTRVVSNAFEIEGRTATTKHGLFLYTY